MKKLIAVLAVAAFIACDDYAVSETLTGDTSKTQPIDTIKVDNRPSTTAMIKAYMADQWPRSISGYAAACSLAVRRAPYECSNPQNPIAIAENIRAKEMWAVMTETQAFVDSTLGYIQSINTVNAIYPDSINAIFKQYSRLAWVRCSDTATESSVNRIFSQAESKITASY